MANINRDYLIVLDAKSSVISEADELKYYITDEHSQNLFVNLVVRDIERINKYVEVHDPEKYQLELHIVKPNNDIVRPHLQANLLSAQDAIYVFELPKEATDYIGTYKCELRVTYKETDETTITTSNKFKYKVKRSIYNDLDSIQEAPQYPVVIQLFDKLSDINQYEEDRRADELARQVAEQQRQTRFDALDAAMVDNIQEMDDKVVEVENRITTKEQAVDKLIVDTKKDIDDYKVAKDTEIDEYKTAKDQQIDQAITNQNNKIDDAIANQNNKIDTAISNQNDRIAVVESNDVVQNNRLDTLENRATQHESRLTDVEAKNTEQDGRLDIVENKNAQQDNRLDVVEGKNVEQDNRLNEIEAIDVAQNTRLDAIEIKNQQQDDRLLDVEKVNKRQDMDLKCLFAESKNNMIDVTEEGNSIYLQNSTVGYTLIDEIQGNTLVNCNKEPDKEITLNGNINTQGYSNVTLTEGVDGGLVDVALEGNTMVNVCNQKDPVAITKSYTVETGNHVALQGEYDGKCRPVVTGNTLWIDNDTEDVLTAFDESKNLRLQSSFEDKVVTQEMVDNGEEVAENLGKYKVDYVVTGKNKLLYPYFETTKTAAGITFTVNNGGSITVNGTATSTVNFYLRKTNKWTLPQGKYTFSINNDDTRCIVGGSNADIGYNSGDGKVTFTMPKNCINTGNLLIQIPNGTTFNNVTLYPQLEEGDTATTYEPYKEYKKTFYLNSPLLKGDTIEQQGDNVVHVHRSELRAYETDDELTLPTDMTNTLVSKPSPTYEVISQNDTILCDSYVNGHLDVDSVVSIKKVDFLHFEEELTYLYPSTQYMVQFVSNAVNKVDITLGGAKLLNQNVVVGTNKYMITALSTLVDNKLVVSGVGLNIEKVVITQAIDQDFGYFEGMKSVGECEDLAITSSNSDGTLSNTQTLTHEPLRAVGDVKDKYVLIDSKWYIERNCGVRAYQEGDIDNYITDMVNTVYPLSTPTYEPIDYNPFTVYSDVTHISNNSTIPCNMTIKNTGYNCLLKPSTTYTVSSNLGLNVVTTPSTLTEDCLRFYDTDTSTVTTMKNVMVLEGDYTTGKPIPSHFSGIESAFEQEYDDAVGKYKVKIRVQNEDATKENYIEFYIDEPLRGIGDSKDRVYVKNDKVVVQRNCGIRPYEDGDFGTHPTDKVNTVYPLAEPVYEEVEYNDIKLIIESFKNSTLFYNSNIPVTSKVWYSYSVPIVDTVAQTANVTDQQDSMIIDLATQVAVMEMMLM